MRQIPKEFTCNLQGRDYVLFPGLLNLAHDDGLQSIETELVKLECDGPVPSLAIVKATVILGDGRRFQGYGDANKGNTNTRVATALVRMAETRAIGRALRFATNIGMTMLEELGDDSVGDGGDPYPPRSAPPRREPSPNGRPPAPTHQPIPHVCATCEKPLTQAQYDLAVRAHGLPAECPDCRMAPANGQAPATVPTPAGPARADTGEIVGPPPVDLTALKATYPDLVRARAKVADLLAQLHISASTEVARVLHEAIGRHAAPDDGGPYTHEEWLRAIPVLDRKLNPEPERPTPAADPLDEAIAEAHASEPPAKADPFEGIPDAAPDSPPASGPKAPSPRMKITTPSVTAPPRAV